MTKFWFDAAGRVLRATDDAQTEVEGAVGHTTEAPPKGGRSHWNGSGWNDPPAPSLWYVPVATARERCERAGIWDALAASLTASQLLKLATLRDGIASDDAAARAAISAAGGDPAEILAPE